jgi:hypothetical protein
MPDLTYRVMPGSSVIADGDLLRWIVVSWVRSAERRRRGALARPDYEERQTRLVLALLARSAVVVADAGDGVYAGFCVREPWCWHYCYTKSLMRGQGIAGAMMRALDLDGKAPRLASHCPERRSQERRAIAAGWVLPFGVDTTETA